MDEDEREALIMLKSMASLGRCENVTNEYKASVEVKTVNHRYLDLSVRMPKKLNYFEASTRTLLREYIQRGKVDLFINYEDYRSGNMCLKYNRAPAAEYMEYFYKMSDKFDIQSDMKVSTLVRFPRVPTMERVPDDEEHLWEIFPEALKGVAIRFMESRKIEEEHLKEDLLGKLDYMEALVNSIEECSPQILTECGNGLEDRVKELLNNTAMEESRTAAEAIIYADEVYVDEETVHLRGHIHNTRNGFLSGEGIGHKLDFIAQEMNQEASITLFKSTDLSVPGKAIAFKVEIEKAREQIQNIE